MFHLIKCRIRRRMFLGATALVASQSLMTGCSTPLFRAQSPDALADIPPIAEPKLLSIRDYASVYDVGPLEVQGIALVTCLPGTGSDPPPSAQRDALINEMQTLEVRKIPELLASPNTSMVLVRAFLPPGVQKGDRVDAEIQLPPRSETTSLLGGWLMRSRMREYRLLNNSLKSGHQAAIAEGAVLVDSLFDSSAGKKGQVRGRILGGVESMQSRYLGLVVRTEHTSVKTSSLIGAAINNRFFMDDRGTKVGVAKPKNDNYIQLSLHPLYKHNVGRYLDVIANIPVGESSPDQLRRIDSLQKQLLEPTSVTSAALQLEGIGKPAIPILMKGLASPDQEVQFYSAEALAYLDSEAPAKTLIDSARSERAFRWRALAALAVMQYTNAYDGLVELMAVSSAETRYGAFRALRTRDPKDPLVAGEILNNEFGLHEITLGESMIHISRSRRPEIVVFGQTPEMSPPNFLYAGQSILITATDDNRLKVTHFAAGKDDVTVTCSPKIVDVVRAIGRVGGNYSDAIQGILSAKERGFITARVEVDAIPRQGREYQRHGDEELSDGKPGRFRVNNPVPDMFFDRLSVPSKSDASELDKERALDDYRAEEPEKPKGIFARMTSWFKR